MELSEGSRFWFLPMEALMSGSIRRKARSFPAGEHLLGP